MISPYDTKEMCCGCGACSVVCSKHAITMMEDEYGFVYPKIDKTKCIDCGLCKKICGFQDTTMDKHIPFQVFAAYSIDLKRRKNASSGGIFEQIGRKFIDSGGYVAGSILDFGQDGGGPYVYHIVSNNKEDLEKMRGSKYVHSDTKDVFLEVIKLLKKGEKVLFSGTPCQVGQMKKLALNYRDNLYTFEILCHGTPSLNMFQKVIEFWNVKLKGNINSFRFRDKALGWGHNVEIIYKKNNRSCKKTMAGGVMAYFALFLKSLIIRPNCFVCPYTGEYRQGDITVGDYWGIQKYHPELGEEIEKGVSCLLVNTERGSKLLNISHEYLKLVESSLDSIKVLNGSLNKPNDKSYEYFTTMEEYRNKGYVGLVQLYKKQMGLKWYTYQIKAMISPELKQKIKKIIRK